MVEVLVLWIREKCKQSEKIWKRIGRNRQAIKECLVLNHKNDNVFFFLKKWDKKDGSGKGLYEKSHASK